MKMTLTGGRLIVRERMIKYWLALFQANASMKCKCCCIWHTV